MRSRWFSWMLSGALATAALATAPPASAQIADRLYLTVDLGVSGPLNDATDELYSPGGDARVGLYGAVVPELSLGIEALGGALAQDSSVPQGVVNRGLMDYGMLAASFRIYPFAHLWPTDHYGGGLYLSGSPGIAVVNGDARLAYTASVGFNFPVGPVTIGPLFRFTHFIDTGNNTPIEAPPNDIFARNDVFMWTGGVEITFGGYHPAPPPPQPVVHRHVPRPAPQARAEVEQPPPREQPPAQPPPQPTVNPELVINERVYFDFDKADLRPAATAELDQVIQHYHRNGDRIAHLVVSGFADDFGTLEYNDNLSAARALAVTNYLVEHGVPLDKIEVRAHGERDPAVPNADTPLGHQMNRRVQFDIDWAPGQRPEGIAPEASPNPPEYVDLIPPAAIRRNQDPTFAERESRAIAQGRSHSQQLLAQEERALEGTLGERVAIAMADRTAPAEGRTVQIETGTASAAVALR